MARLVGVPCGVATQMVLDGEINQVGVIAPYERGLCERIRAVLESEGVTMIEAVE